MKPLRMLLLLVLLLPSLAAAAAGQAAPSYGVGDAIPGFTLVSHDDRTVDYVRDYYGRFALILTFFPAAFTPV